MDIRKRNKFALTVGLTFVGLVAVLAIVLPTHRWLHKPPALSANTSAYVSLFQLYQNQDFQRLETQLVALQPFGEMLEMKFKVNPAREALDALSQKDHEGAALKMEEMVLLDIQDTLKTARTILYAYPDLSMEAIQTARLNYQVLTLFAAKRDPVLTEEVKGTFLTTLMSVKSRLATPELIKTYTDDIQVKLAQMYPETRLSMINSSSS